MKSNIQLNLSILFFAKLRNFLDTKKKFRTFFNLKKNKNTRKHFVKHIANVPFPRKKKIQKCNSATRNMKQGKFHCKTFQEKLNKVRETRFVCVCCAPSPFREKRLLSQGDNLLLWARARTKACPSLGTHYSRGKAERGKAEGGGKPLVPLCKVAGLWAGAIKSWFLEKWPRRERKKIQ